MNKIKQKKLIEPAEISALLSLPEATLNRWIKQGKIPYKVIDKKILFDKSEVINWAKTHDLEIKEKIQFRTDKEINPFSLNAAISRAGIYKQLEGSSIEDILENALGKLNFLQADKKDRILTELLNREALASTGIGNGVALPHTRNRMDLGLEQAYIPLFFPDEPIDFKAVDGKPVSSFFMLFTSSVKEHLKMLSGLSYVLQNDNIQNILQNRDSENILTAISALEK